jgi:hypothetical protein
MDYCILKSLYDDDILLDAEDYEYYKKWNWGINSSGYARRTHYDPLTKKQRTLLLHKDITCTDRSQTIDHINGNKLDNRKCNLRITSNSNNIQRKRYTKRAVFINLSFIGIEPDPKAKQDRYYVRITKNGLRFNFGYYFNPEEAAAVYDKAAMFFYDEYSRLNYKYNTRPSREQLKAELEIILYNRAVNYKSNSMTKKSALKQLEILRSLK